MTTLHGLPARKVDEEGQETKQQATSSATFSLSSQRRWLVSCQVLGNIDHSL